MDLKKFSAEIKRPREPKTIKEDNVKNNPKSPVNKAKVASTATPYAYVEVHFLFVCFSHKTLKKTNCL